MRRLLVPGLLAEGPSDEKFLGAVIVRQLMKTTFEGAFAEVEVDETRLTDCRTVGSRERVRSVAVELADECHVLFVHHDYRERRKAAWLVESLPEQGVDIPVVAIVPIRETEAWLLADRNAWSCIPGAQTGLLPRRPVDVERVPDPKRLLGEIVPRRWQLDELLEFFGEQVDLDTLAQIPAYRAWLEATHAALKGLNYL